MINTNVNEEVITPLKKQSIVGRLKLVAPLSDIYIGIFASTFFINLLGLALPIAVLLIYSRVIRYASYHTLLLLSFGVIVAVLIDTLLRICRNWVSSWSDARFEHLANTHAVKHILNIQISEYEKSGPNTYLGHLNSIHALKNVFGGQTIVALIDLPFVLIYLAFIFHIAGILVLIPMGMLALFGLITYLTSQQLQHQLKQRHQSEDKRVSYILSILTGIHTIKSMALETPILRRYERLQHASIQGQYNLGLAGNIASLISALARQMTIVLIVGIGAVLVISHSLSIGGLAACIILAGRILQPLTRMIEVWAKRQDLQLAEEHLEALSNIPIETNLHLPSFPEIQGKIDIDRLTFGYQNTLLFKNLRLTIDKNEFIGIQGDNQSGKSTLLWLINGMIKPIHGCVLIDTLNIQHYNPNSLRKQIAYLPQTGVLFNGTILDNITLFRPGLNESAYRIAQELGLSALLKKLPKGFDTVVGQCAVEALTPGIKQVICIARALVDNPKIILFDEANQFIDTDLDTHLKRWFEHHKGQKTIIIISNNTSLLTLANRIYRIENKILKEIYL